MQATTTVGTELERQRAHYAAVRKRLGCNPPVKNRLKEVLAAAEKRAADLAEQAQALGEKRAQLLAEANELTRIDRINYEMAYRQNRAKRHARDRKKFLAKYKGEARDFNNRMRFCPFTPEASPALHAAVTTIMQHFRVTWLELIGSGREHHLLLARATLFNVLHDTGFTWYRIASVTGHDVDFYPGRAKVFATRWREKAVTNACFADAMACVSHITPSELSTWKVKKSPFLPNIETTESK